MEHTVQALALAIEAWDFPLHGHLERVQVYALELAKDMGLKGDELEALGAAALLHDIGKLAVPGHIISKPGKLSFDEFERMKTHAVIGAEMLERMHLPYRIAPIVLAHHEKWNGQGYPYGLKARAIPRAARILAAVDCLDALTSDRAYRRAFPIDHAVAHIRGESGEAYDPEVVAMLQLRYRELVRLPRKQKAASA